MSPSRQPDVLVAGAGVVGAGCAFALAREGLRVCLIDGGFVGGGSTASAMGHLVVMDDSEAELRLTAYSRHLWSELAKEMPADCEAEQRGTLWVAATDAEMAAARTKRDRYQSHGIAAEVVDEQLLMSMEPMLRRGLAGALHVSDDSVLYPPAAARHLADRARALGAELRENCTVERIDGRSVYVRERGGSTAVLSAGAVVNAAGIDAPLLTPGLPIVPRKGQLLITDRYPDFCNHQVVELGYLESAHTLGGPSVAFNVQPRATGQLLVGSSRELVGRDPEVNRELLGTMLQRAIHYMPQLASLVVTRSWTGFRPATPDALPLIGRWEGVDGLWIAAGHEGLGITLAPATAALIVDGILGRASAVDPTPFAPGRAMPNSHVPAAV